MREPDQQATDWSDAAWHTHKILRRSLDEQETTS
jgi:hypothetical protein